MVKSPETRRILLSTLHGALDYYERIISVFRLHVQFLMQVKKVKALKSEVSAASQSPEALSAQLEQHRLLSEELQRCLRLLEARNLKDKPRRPRQSLRKRRVGC
jgi:hypothetical protein